MLRGSWEEVKGFGGACALFLIGTGPLECPPKARLMQKGLVGRG